jgi:calcineurin-like phosphoesterase family protein
MNIWFTSDTHYFHTNIAGEKVSTWDKGYRNFNSVQEMNEKLIVNINSSVKEDDILYHLGDWSFGGAQNIFYFRNSLICKNIHLIRGNHDQHILDKDISFKELSFNPYELFSSVNDAFSGYIGKTYFHLSHYSHRVWPKSHKGSIHLFGHSHGSLNGDFGKSMDVGIDCHPEFRPFHINEIVQIMDKKSTKSIDHHGE